MSCRRRAKRCCDSEASDLCVWLASKVGRFESSKTCQVLKVLADFSVWLASKVGRFERSKTCQVLKVLIAEDIGELSQASEARLRQRSV